MEKIKRHLDIEKINGSYSYHVNKVYDRPLFDFKQLSKKSVYGRYIEYIIMKIIKDRIDNNNDIGFIATTTRWFEILGMVNKNYNSRIYKLNDDVIFFHNETYKKIYKIFYDVLDYMAKRNLILYKRTFAIKRDNDNYNIASGSDLLIIDKIETDAADILEIDKAYLWKGMDFKHDNYIKVYNESLEKYNKENDDSIIGIRKVLHIYATVETEEYIDDIIKYMEDELKKEFKNNLSVNNVRNKINIIIINKFKLFFSNRCSKYNDAKVKTFKYDGDNIVEVEDDSFKELFMNSNYDYKIYDYYIKKYISLTCK